MAQMDENNENLKMEAQAFDRQIEERIRNGHIPDLRLVQPCDYFYNNPWRRPEYVKLVFVEQYELIRETLVKQLHKSPEESRVLEIGCGPGYLSLELARDGFNVVGIDLSPGAIEVARKFAQQDPWRTERGTLDYICGDFLSTSELQKESFDALIFLGALHHFPEQENVLSRSVSLIKEGGVIAVFEPARDRITEAHAVFSYLLRVLLSMNHGFYKKTQLPLDADSASEEIQKILKELRYEGEDGEKVQSPNDNEADFLSMYPSLTNLFKEEVFLRRHAFFHQFIGGLRFNEEDNARIAAFLCDMDRRFVEAGVLPATEFFFCGRKLKGVAAERDDSKAPEETS